MSLATLRPAGTATNTGVVTGAASALAALSDNTDASYVTYQSGQSSTVTLQNLILPAGARLKSAVVRLRVARGSTIWSIESALDAVGGSERSVSVTWSSPTTVEMTPPVIDGLTEDALLTSSLFITSSGAALNVYEAYVDVVYVTKPVVDVHPIGT